jgi:phosphate transport system protein
MAISSARTGRLDHVERTALEYALYDAEQRTLAEFDVVRASLRQAADAAIEGDSAAADRVVADTSELDRRYTEVHDRLLALIALQAPVAGDLRLAIALLHVNDRLARMGAQTANIATLCSQMPDGVEVSERQLDCLSEMVRLADEQVVEAQRVLAGRDVDGAERLRERDVAINEHNRRCFALAVEEGDDEARREAAFFVALMARALERIGDNAVDIAHQALFAAEGRLRPGLG